MSLNSKVQAAMTVLIWPAELTALCKVPALLSYVVQHVCNRDALCTAAWPHAQVTITTQREQISLKAHRVQHHTHCHVTVTCSAPALITQLWFDSNF
jgi:hypothetical protein